MLRDNYTISDIAAYLRQLVAGAPKAAVVDSQLAWDYADANEDGVPDHWRVNDLRNVKRKPGTRGVMRGLREARHIRGIVIHQTAEPDLTARHRLIANVPAHALVDLSGAVALLHHPQDYMWHADALNRDTVGLELSCRVPGLVHNRDTFWRSKKEKAAGKTMADLMVRPTDEQLTVAREWCLWMADLLPIECRPLQLWTHRQGTDDKGSDPGEEITRKVICRLVDERPGTFFFDPRATRGNGQTVPRGWWD